MREIEGLKIIPSDSVQHWHAPRKLQGVFATLMSEHHVVLTLMQAVSTTTELSVRLRRFEEVRRRLLAHEAAERSVLCPLLDGHPATRRLAAWRRKEAAHLERVVEALRATPVDDAEWQPMFARLVEMWCLHACEEEEKRFPLAHALFASQAAALDAKYAVQKQIVLRQLDSAGLN